MPNTDTQTSPGIGPLPSEFSIMGGIIIDMVGTSGKRLTQQISPSRLWKGWWPGPAWVTVIADDVTGIDFAGHLGGAIAKANLRLTLWDGDSGSPNPVYVAQFGPPYCCTLKFVDGVGIPVLGSKFYYTRSTPQPPDWDFDGGQNLFFGFLDVFGNPVNCGYMGETTTFRLNDAGATQDTFTGFVGVFGEEDLYVINHVAAPDPYYLPAFAVTGWFQVPPDKLHDLYQALLSGVVQIGIYDISPGDQYYDFTRGVADDIVDIPISPDPPPAPAGIYWLDLWVWRLLTQFSSLNESVEFPPGYEKALRYALAAQLAVEYGRDSSVQEALANDAEAAIEGLNRSNDLGIEDPPVGEVVASEVAIVEP